MYLVDTGDEFRETTLRQPDVEWVSPEMAASIVCVTYYTLTGTFRPGNNYYEVRRKLRGTNGKLSPRGQGHLFNAADLERIMDIRRILHCTLQTAAKVFAAQRKGEL